MTHEDLIKYLKKELLKMKRLILAVAVVFLFVNLSYSQESERHLKKENSWGLKLGGHIYRDNDDLLDDSHVKKSDMSDLVVEIAYERRIKDILSLEFSLGYFDSDSRGYFVYDRGDQRGPFKLEVLNLYFSPTIKGNLPINDTFVFYFGIGPDLYYTEADFKFENKHKDDSFISFGAHGLVGMEIYIMKNPVDYGFYDAPVSLIFEYKYSMVEIEDFEIKGADGKNVNNSNEKCFSRPKPVPIENDLDVGAHKFFAGIKWHF